MENRELSQQYSLPSLKIYRPLKKKKPEIRLNWCISLSQATNSSARPLGTTATSDIQRRYSAELNTEHPLGSNWLTTNGTGKDHCVKYDGEKVLNLRYAYVLHDVREWCKFIQVYKRRASKQT